MKVAIVLPRGMRFSPQGATSIDIVAVDLVCHSRFKETAFVVGSRVDEPFADVDFRPVEARSQRHFIAETVKVLRADLPDVIVVHQHAESANGIAKALPQTPVILHRHGLLRHKKGWLSRWRKGRQLKHIAHIVFVSEFLKQRFLQDHPGYEDKVSVIYNGIDPDFWRPAVSKENLIAFVGRAREDKGVLQVVGAFQQLEHADWRLELILAVQTPEERLLAGRIQSLTANDARISIQENLPLSGVRDVLALSKIVAVPSIVEEGFHRVIIEAQACGCEVIASHRGGAPEAGGEAAHYLDPKRITNWQSDLGSLLQRLMTDGAGQTFGLRARAVEQFAIIQTSKAYDEMLADQGRSGRTA